MRVADHASDFHKLWPVPGEPPFSERARRHAKHGCDLGRGVHESGLFCGLRPCDEHVGGVRELVALRGLDVNDAPVRGGNPPANVDLCARPAGLVNHGGEDQVRGGGIGRVRGDCVRCWLLCHVGTAFVGRSCVALPVTVI